MSMRRLKVVTQECRVARLASRLVSPVRRLVKSARRLVSSLGSALESQAV